MHDLTAAIPRPADRRLAVRVTPDALRQVRGGHPWVYDGAITSVRPDDGVAGDLAVVFDDRRRFAAIGLWDPHSPIRLRVLAAGDPETVDAAFLRRRLEAALARRVPLTDDPGTTGYRIVNGESDALPGLVVDRYDRTIVVKLDTAAWVPHLPDLLPSLVDLLDPERVVLRTSRTLRDAPTHGLADGDVLLGDPPTEPVTFLEHGLRFGADVVRGQKTGHFLDQRENRAAVGRHAADRRVLDVFACTGGFGVHAAGGGAVAVHSVDLAGPALRTAAANMARNLDVAAVARCRHTTEEGDAFDVLQRLARRRERFDLVVVDPPSFARRQHEVERALAAYARLTHLALDVVAPRGLLVQSSCSSRVTADAFVDRVLAAAGGRATVLDRTGHALDHPATIPEAHYLKTVFLSC